MPDLTRVYYWHCLTAEEWQTEVKGSKGAVYTIKWDRFSHKSRHEVQYNYSCTCMAYQTRRGFCKHIEAVKIKRYPEGRCGWTQEVHGGEPVNGKCPTCGGEIRSQAHGV